MQAEPGSEAMSLIRPGMALEPKPVPRLTVEEQVLVELGKVSSTVSEIRDSQREMRQELLGTPDKDESQHGRLPRLESDVKELKSEVKTLREGKIRTKAYIAGAAGVGGVCGAVMGFLGKLVIEFLRK